MKEKYMKHKIYFWLTAIFLLFTIISFGKWEQFLGYLVITVIIGSFNFLVYKTSYISIDGNMVEGKTGILHIQKLSSNKTNISSVKVDKSILGRILNYGTISIDSASSHYTFKMMENPDEIKNKILK